MLQNTEDASCVNSTDASVCGFKTTLTSPASSFFYGRGPLLLQGDVKYAAFSRAFFEGYDRSDMLLNDPDRVATDGYTSWASAIYQWMTKNGYGPSAHNVLTGFWVPNATDN